MTANEHEQARIVVGVDGSASSDSALRWALLQAALTDATVEVVACWHRPAMVSAFVPLAYSQLDLTEATEQTARDALERAQAEVPDGVAVKARTRVVEGYPARVLVEAAAGAALLVVGSHGHGELSGVALGSVGLHCATHAPCPVLVLRRPAAVR